MSDLRAAGDRVLVRRVHNRSKLLVHLHETMGVTDSVFQIGEVVGLGTGPHTRNLRDEGLTEKDLVVYPTPRVYDHFIHHFGANGGECDVLVIPSYWVSAIVKDWFLADHPEEREYAGHYK